MLTVNNNPTFSIEVALAVPGGADEKIRVTFRHKGKAAFSKWLEEMKTHGDTDSLAEIVAGWSGVDAEYSKASLEKLLDAYPSAAHALFAAYAQELGKAPGKNSGPSLPG